MDTTKNYIAWIDGLSKNNPSIRLEYSAASTEEALQRTKTWLKENAAYLCDYTVKIVDSLTRQLLLKTEIHKPSPEVRISTENRFQRSEKKSKTFCVTIYHPDESRFTSLEYEAETPEAALEKAKIYMAREWDGIEIYRAVVKEKQNRQVLLDRVVSQESGPTDEEKALEDERFQAFMRDWKAISSNLTEEAEVRKETSSNFFEEKSSSENEDVRTHQYMLYVACETDFRWLKVEATSPIEALEIGKDWGFKHFRNAQFIVEVHDSSPETGDPIAKSSFDFSSKKTSNSISKVGNSTHFEDEEAETLKDISNATDLYHAANDLIQISKQLSEVANRLLTAK